jgi:hypothetical protein
VPSPGLPADAQLYDVTDEHALGPVKPFVADLTATTARVYAVVGAGVGPLRLAATQQVAGGQHLLLRVQATDAAGRDLPAVVPLHLALTRPDGRALTERYRATGKDGSLVLGFDVPVTGPAGDWKVRVRNQVNGKVATLPVEVTAGKAAPVTMLAETVVFRRPDLVDSLLARGTTVFCPVFDSPRHDEIMAAAHAAKESLAGRGVKLEILDRPQPVSYVLTYAPSAAEVADQVKVDSGQAIGRLHRKTVNQNDWFSAASGWRSGKPLLLFDVAGNAGDAPMAESLGKIGCLWPAASRAWPGKGRAVAQPVASAFGPGIGAVVVQADDAEGLVAGARALAQPLPADRLSAGISGAREALWRQHHVGGVPESPALVDAKLTAKGLTETDSPQPFRLAFPAGVKPASAPADVTAETREVHRLPVTLAPKDLECVFMDPVERAKEEESMKDDMRFTDAYRLRVEVPRAGSYRVALVGTFRYSDRPPRSQAQWEDLLSLRTRILGNQPRKPMTVAVQIDRKRGANLVPTGTAQRAVPITSPGGGGTPNTVTEEVVSVLSGSIELPVGQHELLLVPMNVVDGKLERLELGKER